MENFSTAVDGDADDGLLVAKRSIVAARGRADMPSDVTGGRSDGNDNE
ncbi:hypothetical protein ACIQWA_07750 [Kitasatospora sp. NPDC098652]